MRSNVIISQKIGQDTFYVLYKHPGLVWPFFNLSLIVFLKRVIEFLGQLQIRENFSICKNDRSDVIFECTRTCCLCSIAFGAKNIVEYVEKFSLCWVAQSDHGWEEHLREYMILL